MGPQAAPEIIPPAKVQYLVSNYRAYHLAGATNLKPGAVLALLGNHRNHADRLLCLLCTPAYALIIVAVQSEAVLCHRRMLTFDERWAMIVATLRKMEWMPKKSAGKR